MQATSPWLLNVNARLSDDGAEPFFEDNHSGYLFKLYNVNDSCWLVANWPDGGRIAFRLAYSPDDKMMVKSATKKGDNILLDIQSLIGRYEVVISFGSCTGCMACFTTTFTPSAPLLFPYWPRDILPLGAVKNDKIADGDVRLRQVGTRSGQLYFSLTQPKAGSVLYLQNLTSLADYNQDTETSAGDTVGGEWPEIGFALPPTIKNKPLEAGKKYVLSDVVVALTDSVPANEAAMVTQYLDLLADCYLQLPKPATHYQPWPDILENGLRDLDTPGCWSQVDGNHYLNAYVCDYATPPEIMVQLAVLLPLQDYIEWNGGEMEAIDKIKKGLTAFYSEEYGTIMRWHPKVADKMEGEEEQKEPLTMDSWYLHHPLLNLSRMALKGDPVAKKLFLDSLGFAIKVARHFKYQWPVFYKIDTLEIVKKETAPGKGGEKDVPGLYAHVMLQAWELTGEKLYLAEAEKAALKLRGLGFDLFYQANNTSFAAGAMLRLYKITKKEIYKELSYLCLANVFKNVRLWDCNYGYGKNFPSFFALFPLNDAPYTAVYEEQEVFCALHEYLNLAEGMDILPSLRLLIAEYIKYLVERAVYYYPTKLPTDMLSDKPKMGEVDPKLWIALEDLHDGWEQCGEVGQEVYGAGNAFGIIPRHYLKVPGEDFLVYTDYPTYSFSARKGHAVTFKLAGDERLTCKVMLVKTNTKKLPSFNITIDNKTPVEGKLVKDGNYELTLKGNQQITINWKH